MQQITNYEISKPVFWEEWEKYFKILSVEKLTGMQCVKMLHQAVKRTSSDFRISVVRSWFTSSIEEKVPCAPSQD